MSLRRHRQTFEQQRRWSTERAEAKKERWLLLGANASLVVPAVLVLAIPVMPSLWRGIVAGALIASSFGMTYGVLLIRTYAVTMGEWRESWTESCLIEDDAKVGGSSMTCPWSTATSTMSPSQPARS
jgi:hypothetical protein